VLVEPRGCAVHPWGGLWKQSVHEGKVGGVDRPARSYYPRCTPSASISTQLPPLTPLCLAPHTLAPALPMHGPCPVGLQHTRCCPCAMHGTFASRPNLLLLLLLLLQLGDTPLHRAAELGHLEAVLQLLAAGAAAGAINRVRLPHVTAAV
jgi:hypothetical protein